MDRDEIAELDDDTLAARAAGGDSSAFEEIHRRYAPVVHGILLSRLPVSECEDLLQDVFTAAFEGIGNLRERSNLGPWLAAIARNHAAGYFRRRKGTTVPLDSKFAARATTQPPDGAMLLDEIGKLPEAYRETLILRFVEGFTGPEIAGKTGLTHGSVRVNLSRGIELLRERFRCGARREEGL